MTQSLESSTPSRDARQFHMAYTRIYSSADGGSHFQDELLPMTPGVYVPGIPLVDSAESQTALQRSVSLGSRRATTVTGTQRRDASSSCVVGNAGADGGRRRN
jgi:hypothetical protein